MKLLLSITLLICSLSAAAQKELPFQLPIVPETIEGLQPRSDFYIEHFWDFCDLKKSFSARDKMADAFDMYIELMPYASAEVVQKSIGAFMKKLEKQPMDQIFIGELAEGRMYSDTATIASDELYLWFIEPIVANKRVDKDYKLRFQHQAQSLRRSQAGMTAPEFTYTGLDGQKHTFAADSTRIGTILFFNDPDCTECSMARLRLDADVQTTRQIETGRIDFYSIYPGEADQEWLTQAMGYPKIWQVGAAPEIDEIYDIRTSPCFYVLNPQGKILIKTASPNVIIDIMSKLAPPRRRKAANQ